MGPYCRYCDHRCFVPRVLPAAASPPFAGKDLIMATCARGMAYDLEQTGYTHLTAINPRAPKTPPASEVH